MSTKKKQIKRYTRIPIKDGECHSMTRVRAFARFNWNGHSFNITLCQNMIFPARFVCSHAGTGLRVPGSYYKTVQEAIAGGRASLGLVGLEKFEKALSKGRDSLFLLGLIPARRKKS